jgi:hypothetical protein
MRFMVIGMATKESEAGPPPTAGAFAAMQQYNEELNVSPSGKGVVEIRKLMDVEDFVENFGDAFTPNEEIAKVKY